MRLSNRAARARSELEYAGISGGVADGCDDWVADPKQPGTDTVDYVHPNAQGDEKIARGFLRSLEQLVPGDSSRSPRYERQRRALSRRRRHQRSPRTAVTLTK